MTADTNHSSTPSLRIGGYYDINHFYYTTPCWHGICHSHVFVCLSVTSQCSTEMAKLRIMQTAPHDSPGTSFLVPKISAKLEQGHPKRGANAGGWVKIGDFHQITHYNSKASTIASVVNLVRLPFYHTERPPLFAAVCCDAARRVGSSATADTCSFCCCSCCCFFTIDLLHCDQSVIISWLLLPLFRLLW